MNALDCTSTRRTISGLYLALWQSYPVLSIAVVHNKRLGQVSPRERHVLPKGDEGGEHAPILPHRRQIRSTSACASVCPGNLLSYELYALRTPTELGGCGRTILTYTLDTLVQRH